MDLSIENLIIKALVLFTAVPVHECAHAWTAEKLGDDTGRRQGRITLNPFAHLTPWGSLMMIFAGFGWGKPVGIDPSKFKNPKRGMMLSALAGPASNFIMAFLAMTAYRVFLIAGAAKENEIFLLISYVFYWVSLINISLGTFNFLPIPPLDGSKIFNAILPDKVYFTVMKYEQYIFIALLFLLYTGLLDAPLSFLQSKVLELTDFLTGWVELLLLPAFGAAS